MTAYAELQVTSNYSFLRGGSHPDELVLAAKALGLAALGLADRNTLAGVVRAHTAAKQAGLKLLIGARLIPEDGPEVLCYPTDRAAYGRLCRLLTLGKRRAEKGDCRFTLAELEDHGQGQVLIVLPPESPGPAFGEILARLGRRFAGACYLAGQVLYRGDDARALERLSELAAACATPLVATNDVRLHAPARKALLDVLTCVREHCTIDTAGFRLEANAERHLKAPAEMARLFREYPEAIERTIEIAGRCRFSLDELRYEYPEETTAPGRTSQEELAELTRIGAAARYPGGVPGQVQATLDHELALIGQLGYAPYFLTVHDLVRFARGRGILCQGR
ncbi:MAG: PHP domain-containing protein, partial [Proteobacteria bacterium]|nr:PHP domain-containing protein [Pseudomonadota bacterium]